MIYKHMDLVVPGQVTGAAGAELYLLDALSVAPEKSRPMVIIISGGGYQRKSDREAEPVALRFLAMGCHACVLDYSVAPSRFPTSLLELFLATAKIREHAKEWHVDPEAIVICGFSAGGHLAACAGAFWNRPELYAGIHLTPEQVRPNGEILCYPVITSGEYAHKGSFEQLLGPDASKEAWELVSIENQVGPDMPPTFLWHTDEDETVPLENSLLLISALRKHKVSLEVHIYPAGRHGLSLAVEETAGNRERSVEPCCQSWISLVQCWMENRFIKEHGGQTLV